MSRTMVLAVAAALVVGFYAGFILRPVIAPLPMPSASRSVAVAAAPAEPRETQYFLANLDEARRVTAQCRDGSGRGDECANAERAIIEAESRERFKRFRER